MLEAARTVRRLRDPGWCGEKGQGRWQAKKLLEWAAKELIMTMSRRDIELEFGDIQDWRQRKEVERKMWDSLLKWLGLDKPPQQRSSTAAESRTQGVEGAAGRQHKAAEAGS